MGLLADIVETKRGELERVRALVAEARGAKHNETNARRDVAAILARGSGDRRAPLRLITEVKLRSPSAGSLSRALTPGERAAAYARAGASMVSVLADATYFDGAWAHVTEARAALDAMGDLGTRVPVLAKEFVIDEAQISCAKAHGADAVLVIARIVSRENLRHFVTCAEQCSLTPLVEVATDAELDSALDAGAKVIGVNARDLDTLAMDAESAARIVAKIPQGVIAIHLSGVRDADAVKAIAKGRADAALLGEALMRADDPAPLLGSMIVATKA